MKSVVKRRFKPRIKSKNKSYTLKDSALYNLSTKKRLETVLGKTVSELKKLSSDDSYRVFSLEKEGKKPREIQAPKFDLDVVHTRIATLLVRVAMPDYVHSGVKGKSNITNAYVHIGDHPALTMDIKNFYPSITKKSMFHFFNGAMKAAPDVAGILAELCSYEDHIPTGSRLSMPLSYWTNSSMYSRIYSLCDHKEVSMSIFVDDLTFSGANVNGLLKKNIEEIIECSGLAVHPEKTRFYNRETPKLITGAIVGKSGMKVRNKHHKDIYTSFSDMKLCKDDAELEIIQKQLVGRLNAAAQIDPLFKQRAVTYQKRAG